MPTTGSSLVTVKTRRGYNRTSGQFTEYLYEGPRDSIYGMIGELGGADSWELDHDGIKYSLKVRYSAAQESNTVEAPVDEFRLHANRITVSVYNHSSFSVLTPAMKRFVRESMETSSTVSFSGTMTDEQLAAVNTLQQLLSDGVEHFVVNQPVIIRSRVASSEYNFTTTNGPFTNVGAIISPASIIADAGLASIVKTVLPDGGSDGTYVYGWLKHHPEYTEAAGNKGVLSQEYEFGRWAIAIYGAAI